MPCGASLPRRAERHIEPYGRAARVAPDVELSAQVRGPLAHAAETVAFLQVRVSAWYASLERDSVVAAHGGVCRALIAHLNLAEPEAASMGDIGQGCVYVFDGNSMARHE